MAVSPDIQNAFNTVGWDVWASCQTPYELFVHTSASGFCTCATTASVTMKVMCGVLQGSVLMSFLWNVAFDTMFRLPLPTGDTIIGYADDTLVPQVFGDRVRGYG